MEILYDSFLSVSLVQIRVTVLDAFCLPFSNLWLLKFVSNFFMVLSWEGII